MRKNLVAAVVIVLAALTGCSTMENSSSNTTALHGWVVASDSDALTLDVAAQGLGRPMASHVLFTEDEITSITCSDGSPVTLDSLEADDELEIDSKSSRSAVQVTIVVAASSACA